MAKKCKCCAREIAGSKCGYCKYTNLEVLDDLGSEVELERMTQYKVDLLSRITDFSINAYSYKWNASTSKLDAGRKHIIIADGVKQFDEIVWSQKSFGQSLNEKQSERPITVLYKFDGKEKKLNINLKTIKCKNLWKFGVVIHQNMTVSFCLGTVDEHTITGPFDLDFE